METLVSIIVPVYNGEKYIKKCIDSIKNQTYTKIEIIIINDGSTDNTENIIKELEKNDTRIKILNKKNKGVSAARNDGLQLSKGQYIVFIDADDYVESDMVEILLKDMIANKVNIVRCNYNYVKEDGNFFEESNNSIYYNENKYIKGIDLIDKIIDREVQAFSVLLMVNKEIISSIKFDQELTLMEDVVFYTQLCVKEKKIYIEDKCLYHVYLSSNSATRSSQDYLKKIEAIRRFNEKYRKVLKDNNIYTEERMKNINRSNFIFIMDILLKISQSNSKIKDKILDYKKVFKENKEIINQCYIKNIKFDIRLPMQLGRNKHFYLMYYFFKIKNKVKKISKIRS